MTTLAEKRKDAIKVHDLKTQTVIKELNQIASAMEALGLTTGSETITRIVSSIEYDLKTLKTSASVN